MTSTLKQRHASKRSSGVLPYAAQTPYRERKMRRNAKIQCPSWCEALVVLLPEQRLPLRVQVPSLCKQWPRSRCPLSPILFSIDRYRTPVSRCVILKPVIMLVGALIWSYGKSYKYVNLPTRLRHVPFRLSTPLSLL